ncbi:MAG: ATP-dependent helicase, partial [Parachlamydiaceae bacterium]|nr:ATP-dependent helicase [Parachlamydiaceae bacterium]
YSIVYGYGSSGLPNQVTLTFNEIEMSFYLSAANLPSVIPSLASVESQLKVFHAPEEEIDSVYYDKENATLTIIPRVYGEGQSADLSSEKKDTQGIILDGWLFISGEGFYARDPHQLLEKKVIESDEVSQLLTDYAPLIKKRLKSGSLHEIPVEPKYSFSFDTAWNLHIVAYLFSPGDLSASGSRSFGDWAYLEDDGFYRLEKGHYDELETTVLETDLPDFIAQNRVWLNTQEGFRVYLSSVESHLVYHLSDDNRLSFTRQILTRDDKGEAKEFGQWVYVPGEGFYSKETTLSGLAQLSGLVINREQIPLFIKANQDELLFVPGFFSPRFPVRNGGLGITIKSKEHIDVTPHFELMEEYVDKEVRFFDDFSYVAGEGFHELPTEMRLPERFRHPLHIGPEELEIFLTYELDTLKPYIAKIDPQLIRPDRMKLIATAPGSLEAVIQGYLLKIKYETNIGSLPATVLWFALKAKKKFLFSDAGLIDLSDKRFNWLRWLDKKQVDRRSQTIQLSTIELIRLHALEEVEVSHHKGTDASPAQLLLEELIEFRTPQEPVLTGLASELRPYQHIGLKWLWFLHSHRLSGLLCDDMGLGKTHQTMALIAAIRNKSPTPSKLPMLVVCPTSVIYHWQEKLEAFLPGLKVYTFYGIERSLENFEGNYDVLLTSYGVYRLECESLSKIPFELAIFDEIQLAKNHSSRIYASLLAVNAKMRLGLTGTPIENHLRELKALFDIVLPLYMPMEADYRELFVKPIERESNRDRQRLLSRMIKPFVMRRRKEDVLLDLPEKMEEVSHCDLYPEQVKLYNDLLLAQKERLLKVLEDEGADIPYMHIFALLAG